MAAAAAAAGSDGGGGGQRPLHQLMAHRSKGQDWPTLQELGGAERGLHPWAETHKPFKTANRNPQILGKKPHEVLIWRHIAKVF